MRENDTYNQLLSYLRTEIQDHKKGTRLPSYRSLMKEFKCSQGTVNRIMHILEEEGLVERRRASGVYVTGKRIVQGDTVLFVVPDVSIRAYGLIVRDGERVARQHGFRAQVFNYRQKLSPLPEPVLRQCRALVLVPRIEEIEKETGRAFLESLPQDLPVVLLEHDIPGTDYTYFGYKDTRAGRTAAQIFKEQGIEKAACLGSSQSHTSQSRLRGFAKEWGRSPEMMIDFSADPFVDQKKLQRLIDSDIEGLFISRPDIVLQVLSTFKALGVRIPKDLFVAAVCDEGDDDAYPYRIAYLEIPSGKAARDGVRAVLAGLKHHKRMSFRVVVPEDRKQ
jgi:GntR family transcriptional regulator of arabinose operon